MRGLDWACLGPLSAPFCPDLRDLTGPVSRSLGPSGLAAPRPQRQQATIDGLSPAAGRVAPLPWERDEAAPVTAGQEPCVPVRSRRMTTRPVTNGGGSGDSKGWEDVVLLTWSDKERALFGGQDIVNFADYITEK